MSIASFAGGPKSTTDCFSGKAGETHVCGRVDNEEGCQKTR